MSVASPNSSLAGLRETVVFVGRDQVLGPTLDAAAVALQRLGHSVIRGHAEDPPRVTRYSPAEANEYFRMADAILVSSRTVINADMMRSAPRLRGVAFVSIGSNSIDLAAATELGIVVANGATRENVESVAEASVMLMVALMLDLAGKQRQFSHRLPRPEPSMLSARMVSGSTIGLIGFGRIAQAVAKRLAPWGVEIIAHRKRRDAGTVPGVEFVGLHELLSRSDVVSVHLPLTPETRGLLGVAELALMKRDAYVINTSRGGIVDEIALAAALNNGDLAGAAIDVFETEPPPADHALRGLENVILTEHTVGCTRELFSSLVPTAVENVVRIVSGREPLHVCNRGVLHRWQERMRRAG